MVAPRQSLLQRLLAKEIKQEQSSLLQCLRFIVNNNFLQDMGAKPLIFPSDPHTAVDAKAGESVSRLCLLKDICDYFSFVPMANCLLQRSYMKCSCC